MSVQIQLSRKQIILGVAGIIVLVAVITLLAGLFIKKKSDDKMYEMLLSEKDKQLELVKEHEAFVNEQLQETKELAANAIVTAAEDRKLFLANQKNYLSINSRYEKIPQRITDISNAGDDAIRAAFRDY